MIWKYSMFSSTHETALFRCFARLYSITKQTSCDAMWRNNDTGNQKCFKLLPQDIVINALLVLLGACAGRHSLTVETNVNLLSCFYLFYPDTAFSSFWSHEEIAQHLHRLLPPCLKKKSSSASEENVLVTSFHQGFQSCWHSFQKCSRMQEICGFPKNYWPPNNWSHASFSNTLKFSLNLLYFVNFRISGPTKIQCCCLASFLFWNFTCKYANPAPVCSIALTKLLNPTLIWIDVQLRHKKADGCRIFQE